MTNRNEQEKKKFYISPAMQVIEIDCRSSLLQGSNPTKQSGMNMVIDD